MCGTTVVDGLEVQSYAAQHLGRSHWVEMEDMWRREELHSFEEEFRPAWSSPRGPFHDENFAESQDEEEVYVPQSCSIRGDMAVWFGIELMKTLVEILVVEEVEILAAVELDHVE
jgi:hypothetical protein